MQANGNYSSFAEFGSAIPMIVVTFLRGGCWKILDAHHPSSCRPFRFCQEQWSFLVTMKFPKFRLTFDSKLAAAEISV